MAKYKFTKTFRYTEGICIDSEKGTVTPLMTGKAAHGIHVVIDCPSLLPKKENPPKPHPVSKPHPISQKKQSSAVAAKRFEVPVSTPRPVTFRQLDSTWGRSPLPANASWKKKDADAVCSATKAKKPQKPLGNNGRKGSCRDVVCVGCHKPKFTVRLTDPANPYHGAHVIHIRDMERSKQKGGYVINGIICSPINRQAGLAFQKKGNEARFETTLRK